MGNELPIMDIKGKDYLQVAYRLVWFREQCPDWSIETELVQSSENFTLFKATIKDPSGKVIATAHKQENQKGFPDNHLEKSETGAIGRALAMCGYGTQFAPELEEGERLADSPLTNGTRTPFESNEIRVSGVPNAKLDQGAAQTNQGDPGAFVITWGKYKGQALSQIESTDLDGYCKWIVSKSIADQKELTGKVRDLIINAELYLNAIN